ncbi:hypothetical protein GCM10011611_63540 [Aliidongia dinghuensis]|uniref:YfhO family protein n=1 Tax=Aliidongia dinghuensis TaxID=1867774 RepID=A0A8J2YZZ9_9PROT|nr:DUF6311 domain-containing protein [Aliidongia dinghuensis]GGF48420.1 hypothetical protein GCM10011611_63540 [Aliidongia dinghuensis]
MTVTPSRAAAAKDRIVLLPRASEAGISEVRWQALLFAVLGAVAGYVNVWLLVGWHHINPSDLSWLVGDPAQYQAAWEFLRHQKGWGFPLTWVDGLGYPLGVSASYLDVIPLVAVPLRLLSGWLPTDFQYLGLYAVACHSLQAYFGFRLVARFVPRDILTCVIGGIFFLVSPALTWRLFGHYALSTQWVIIAGLYYYFAPLTSEGFGRYVRPFLVLSAIASAINPYISLFAAMIGGAAIYRAYLEGQARLVAAGAVVAAISLVTLATLAVFGFLIGGDGTQFAGNGYTLYSLNLLSPIDPAAYPSILLKTQPSIWGQYEGYNYLGLGVVGLLLIGLARRPGLALQLWSPALRPLFLISALCTLLALSVKITAGTIVVWTIPVPDKVFHALASFRASGRLFWPAHYAIILAAIGVTTVAVRSRWALRLCLGLALIIQVVDLMPLRHSVHAAAKVTYSNPLTAPDWGELSKNHRHIVVLPAWQCGLAGTPGGSGGWYWFARLAARSGLTENSFYPARISPAAEDLYCSKMPDDLLHQGFKRDTAYVLDDDLAVRVATRPGNEHYCRRVDGFNLCTHDPQRAGESYRIVDETLRPYQLGTEITARDEKRPTAALVDGLEEGTQPAHWTLGHKLSVDLRPVLPPSGDLRIEADFGWPPVVTAQHPQQRAIVRVNEQVVGEWTFVSGESEASRSAIIPRDLLEDGKVVSVTFDLPDAVTPQSLGINTDGRTLALSVKSLRIVPVAGGQ